MHGAAHGLHEFPELLVYPPQGVMSMLQLMRMVEGERNAVGKFRTWVGVCGCVRATYSLDLVRLGVEESDNVGFRHDYLWCRLSRMMCRMSVFTIKLLRLSRVAMVVADYVYILRTVLRRRCCWSH
jgi:hypothetical protein